MTYFDVLVDKMRCHLLRIKFTDQSSDLYDTVEPCLHHYGTLSIKVVIITNLEQKQKSA